MSRLTLLFGAILLVAFTSCKKDDGLDPANPIACFSLDKTVYQPSEWIVVYDCSEDTDLAIFFLLGDGQTTMETDNIVQELQSRVDSFRISTPGVYRLLQQANNGIPGSPVNEYMHPIRIEE